MTRVLLVEDSRISRESIERRISEMPDYSIVTSIENAANAEIVCMGEGIDLILMDVCTADDESGLRAAEKIKKLYPHIKIIIMTSMPEYSFIEKARRGGCDSFWYKEYGSIDLIDICRRTMNGESVYPEKIPSLKIGLADSSEFTDRELQVIRELVSGNKYSEIAQTLGVKENTVKFHVKSILSKTGYKNAIQLVADVVEKRMVLPKY